MPHIIDHSRIRSTMKQILLGWCLLMSAVYKTLQCSHETSPTEPLVEIKQGKLKGEVKELLDGTPFYSFKGIPYAKPPIKELRFSAPQPPEPWSGVYNATEHGPVCTQFDSSQGIYVEGNENCLFVNVYTKSLKSCSKMPVMVWIHGGSHKSGNGNAAYGFGPDFLVPHGVILVTLNYRLEVLGFLSVDTADAPGNAGLKDQALALRWVNENIHHFGGDPHNVTLFGQSAGSSDVTLHLLSPMSKGLFQKAIAQSGVAIQDWGHATNWKERAFRLAKLLGSDATDAKQVLEFLRSVPANKLTNVTYDTMSVDEQRRDVATEFLPVVEKKFDNVEAFMTEAPIDALVNKKINGVPLMIGHNSNEAIFMIDDLSNRLELYNENPQYLIPREIAEQVSEEKTKEFGKGIKKYYVKDNDFSKDTPQPFADFLSDRHFNYNIHRFANYYSKIYPTYFYFFNYVTELNMIKKLTGKTDMQGVSHGDELFYMFYSPINKAAYEANDESMKAAYEVTKLWTDFAKTGNPTPDPAAEIKWPLFTNGTQVMEIKSNTAPINIDLRRINFWDKMYCEVGIPCIEDIK